MDFLLKLFDTSDFPQRWYCGEWSSFHGWLHIISDLAVFTAYTAIPLVIIYFVARRKDVQFPNLFWLFCAFIFACGTVHLIEALIFWVPIYRFAGVMKCFTAIASWATVIALIRIAPNALQLPTMASLNEKLKNETHALRAAQSQLEETLKELQLAKSLNDAIIQSVGNGIVVVLNDAPNEPAMMNPKAIEMAGSLFGTSPSEWSLENGVFKDDGETLCRAEDLPQHRVLIHGQTVQGEEFLLRSENQSRWVRASATRVSQLDKPDMGVVITLDDITELKKQRDAREEVYRETSFELTQTNQLLDRIVNSVADVVWRGELDENEQLKFVYLSPVIEQLTGMPPDHFVGRTQNWINIIHSDDRSNIKNQISRFVKEPDGFVVKEYRVIHDDKSTRWVRNRVQSTTVDGKRNFHGIMADITQEKLAKEALIHSERLASIGTLAAGIAHEINNPLGAMLLTTEHAKTQVIADSPRNEVVDSLDNILDQIDRCSKIVKNVLRFSRQQFSVKEPNSIVEIAERSIELMEHKAKRKQISISLHDNAGSPYVLANSPEIDQVCINLLANAINASESAATIKLIIEKQERFICVSIHDEGSGMTEEVMKRAFDPFFTMNRNSGGTGLGLSLCHTIITDHGGSIQFESSKILSGTKVTFQLPHAETSGLKK